MEEIEAKFLNIDADAIEKKLLALGATKKYDRVFRDRVFDFPGWPLDADKAWLRLRDKGDKITLSFKQRFGTSEAGDAGMDEVEIVVDDFENTSNILSKIGMVVKFDQEKRRVHYKLDGVEVDIDTYPLIPTLLEIEGKNWDEVKNTAKKLGLEWSDRKQFSGMQVYDEYGISLKDYLVMTFEKQDKR